MWEWPVACKYSKPARPGDQEVGMLYRRVMGMALAGSGGGGPAPGGVVGGAGGARGSGGWDAVSQSDGNGPGGLGGRSPAHGGILGRSAGAEPAGIHRLA